MGFLENEQIRVFNIVDEQWWQGLLCRNGHEGIFPKDFVDVLVDLRLNLAIGTPTKKVVSSRDATPAKLPPTPKLGNYRLLAGSKSTPGLYSQYVLGLQLSGADWRQKAHTSEDLVEQRRRADRRRKPRDEIEKRQPRDDVLESISQKRQQLELELMNLRRLEQLHLQKAQLDLYVSEDLMLQRPELELEDETDGPPPPPKARGPGDSLRGPPVAGFENSIRASPMDSLRGTPSGLDSLVRSNHLKLLLNKLLQSDVLNLLELSATSAGLFMRHKHDSIEADRMALLNLDDEPDKRRSLFRMLRKKKPENLMEQRLQADDQAEWQSMRRDFNRMNTLSLADKQQRTKRTVRGEANFIAKPLDFVTEINESETFGPDGVTVRDLKVNSRKVAEFSERYTVQSDFNDLILDVSVKFGTWRPNEIRAILLHLCKFRILDEPERISQTKPRLAEVMLKGEATIFQLNYLFKKLLEALKIPAEVVLGFWKKPNEFYHDEQYVINHCWLSVMVETDMYGNGVFRLVDLMCFQNGSICNKPGFNEHYFLAEPLDLVSTHIPLVIEFQHVCPPVDLNVAYHMPRSYSGWRKNGLSFVNFNNALTRMKDLEFFEADIAVPESVELFTLIKTARTTSNDYTLCQVYWHKNRRMAKIKAILPEKEDVGVLQIFAGPKGLQTHFDNIHELACVIPLYHFGQYKGARFVPRFPTIHSQAYDLYIRHPQLLSIVAKNSYNFEVDAHPSDPTQPVSDLKLVVESPSGKYTRLLLDGDTYRANIYANELGVFRGLVIGDSGSSWYVFAQWECVAR